MAEKLDDIKWIFDGKKIDKLPKDKFINALKSSKNDLFHDKVKKLFEQELQEKFIVVDDLIEALNKNDNWFNKIFIISQ